MIPLQTPQKLSIRKVRKPPLPEVPTCFCVLLSDPEAFEKTKGVHAKFEAEEDFVSRRTQEREKFSAGRRDAGSG